MINDELISIIVPCYNVGEYIGETLDSLVRQTYKNIEIIVVNDGSTDNTVQRVETVVDNRIRIVNKPNGGASSARNKGLAVAKGDIISFVDGDDILEHDTYEQLIHEFSNHQVNIVTFPIMFGWQSDDHRVVSATGGVKQKKKMLYDLMLSGKASFSSCNKLYRKAIFDSVTFNEEVLYEDILFWNDIIENTNCQIMTSDKGLYYYRSHGNSFILSKASERKLSDLINNSLTIYDNAKKAKVNFVRLTFYYLSIIEDVISQGLFELDTSENGKLIAKLAQNFPSKFKFLLLRAQLKIGSKRYKQYQELRRELFSRS